MSLRGRISRANRLHVYVGNPTVWCARGPWDSRGPVGLILACFLVSFHRQGPPSPGHPLVIMFPPWPSALFLVSVASIASASLPLVDFDRMGQVGLTGSFAGLDFFDNSTSTSFDPSVSTLLSRTPQGALTSIANTNSGGSISSACAMNNVYYIAGSFLSIANISTSYVVSYSLSSGAFSALGSGGPNGPVSAVYCDPSNDNLWVGGHFSSPSPSVAMWSSKSNTWSAPPFKGLDGQVMSITSNASDTSLFFTGSFTTSFSGGVTSNNNNPNVPYSQGASPFSSSLVPIPLQGAEVVGAPSSANPEFSNIQAILCPAGPDGPGNTWLASAGNAALITVRTFAAMSAYGVRIGNTFLSGYGTTAFRYSLNPWSCLNFVFPLSDVIFSALPQSLTTQSKV